MQVNDMYKGTYLKAADIISSGNIGVTITEVTEVTFEGQKGAKYALHLAELDQALVLNKTNAMAVVAITGSTETNDWTGAKVMLTTEKTQFNGNMVDSVRIHPLPQQAQPVQMAVQPNEDIPF